MRKRSPEQEARRTSLIVLFMLFEEPRSGYDIRTLIEKWRVDEYIPVSSTTVYRALARIEKQGYVESSEEKRGNYPTAKIYRITKAGREAYAKLVEKESEFADTAYASNVFLSMATHLSREDRARLAKHWQSEARAKIEDLSRRIDDNSDGGIYGKSYPEWLLLDHERDQLAAEIAWMDKFCRLLETHEA